MRRGLLIQKKSFILIFVCCSVYLLTYFGDIIPNINGYSRMISYPTDLELIISGKLKLKPELSQNVNNCKLCTFIVRNTKQNSSIRDCLILVGFGTAKNMIPILKTLRTTGCKATCVFLLDNEACKKISEKTLKIIDQCGGQIINIGEDIYTKMVGIYSSAQIYQFLFILYNKGTFNRVISGNLYDTAFQGDPFNEYFPKKELYMVDELYTLSIARNNADWIAENNYTVKNLDQFYYCAGFIGGTEIIMLRTYYIFSSFLVNGKKIIDQGIFNYLYMSGIFNDNGIKILYPRNNELVCHFVGYLPPRLELGYITGHRNQSIYATVAHQYYWYGPDFQKSILKYCPKEYPDLENYLRDDV